MTDIVKKFREIEETVNALQRESVAKDATIGRLRSVLAEARTYLEAQRDERAGRLVAKIGGVLEPPYDFEGDVVFY